MRGLVDRAVGAQGVRGDALSFNLGIVTQDPPLHEGDVQFALARPLHVSRRQ